MTRVLKRPRKGGGIRFVPDVSKQPVIKIDEICSPSDVTNPHEQEPITSSITLQNLLSPLDEEAFLEKCFRECAVYIPSMPADRDRFKLLREHLYDLDPRMLLSETASDNIFVWLKHANGLIRSIEVSDAEAALALLNCGHSTYCRAPPLVEQHLVSSLLAGTGFGCGQYDSSGQSATCFGRGEVEVFISSPGHQTNWHYDFQENFTLQLSGVKRWSLQRGTIKHPLRGCTPHYASPDAVEGQLKSIHLSDDTFRFGHPETGVNAEGVVNEVVLQPGDVLYFPAGMWHKVEVIESGVSINISLMASSYAEITCSALKHLLLKQDDWREPVSNNSSTNVVERLKSLLEQLPRIIKDFERKNGAASIVPPVMRQGASMPLLEGALEDELEDDGSASTAEGDEEDLVVVNADFIAKYEISASELAATMDQRDLSVNELAVLLNEDQIKSFYNSFDTYSASDRPSARVGDSDEAELKSTFVININYAGNDAHESLVRRRIRAHGSLLPLLHNNPNDFKHKLEQVLVAAHERAVLGFLIQIGYLVWTQKLT